MFPSVKFAEDKVLVFVILREECENSATLSLTLIPTLISITDSSDKSERYFIVERTMLSNKSVAIKERTQTTT